MSQVITRTWWIGVGWLFCIGHTEILQNKVEQYVIPPKDPKQCGGKKIMHYNVDDDVKVDDDDVDDDGVVVVDDDDDDDIGELLRLS
jgi:hypothetical protein